MQSIGAELALIVAKLGSTCVIESYDSIRWLHERLRSAPSYLCPCKMAPKHRPAPTLVGDRVVNLIVLVQDERVATQLQQNPGCLETIARSWNCYQCEVITSVGVNTVFDAMDGRRVVLNEEIRHLFDDRVWLHFVDKQDFGEVGYMVSVMHSLRLLRACRAPSVMATSPCLWMLVR